MCYHFDRALEFIIDFTITKLPVYILRLDRWRQNIKAFQRIQFCTWIVFYASSHLAILAKQMHKK